MSVKVNINAKDLKSKALNVAKEKISKQSFDVECPGCKKTVNVPAGKSICPFCGQKINLNLDIKF